MSPERPFLVQENLGGGSRPHTPPFWKYILAHFQYIFSVLYRITKDLGSWYRLLERNLDLAALPMTPSPPAYPS